MVDFFSVILIDVVFLQMPITTLIFMIYSSMVERGLMVRKVFLCCDYEMSSGKLFFPILGCMITKYSG
jgi:hypothetical protein